jgi:hypothetical protein
MREKKIGLKGGRTGEKRVTWTFEPDPDIIEGVEEWLINHPHSTRSDALRLALTQGLPEVIRAMERKIEALKTARAAIQANSRQTGKAELADAAVRKPLKRKYPLPGRDTLK